MNNNLKLSLANFDYYLLRIGPGANLDQIASKFSSLREFDKTSKYLVVECAEQHNLANFTEQLNQLDKLANSYGLQTKFVLANQFISGGMINQKPVIELPATLKSKPIFNQSLVIEDPVRSGIKIENDGDIIITGLVSHNAEIVATGNVHIYGDCRGRVMAGIRGNKKSRIFVGRFNAELISIAGIYRVLEESLPASLHNQGVQIFLDDKERLNIIPLGL